MNKLLVNKIILVTLNEAKRFDYLIKVDVPTLACLLQSIDEFQKFENFGRTSGIDKTLGFVSCARP
jgi:hypothetical protein